MSVVQSETAMPSDPAPIRRVCPCGFKLGKAAAAATFFRVLFCGRCAPEKLCDAQVAKGLGAHIPPSLLYKCSSGSTDPDSTSLLYHRRELGELNAIFGRVTGNDDRVQGGKDTEVMRREFELAMTARRQGTKLPHWKQRVDGAFRWDQRHVHHGLKFSWTGPLEASAVPPPAQQAVPPLPTTPNLPPATSISLLAAPVSLLAAPVSLPTAPAPDILVNPEVVISLLDPTSVHPAILLPAAPVSPPTAPAPDILVNPDDVPSLLDLDYPPPVFRPTHNRTTKGCVRCPAQFKLDFTVHGGWRELPERDIKRSPEEFREMRHRPRCTIGHVCDII